MELIVDVIVDSVLDTLELVPLLFVTYLAMEAIEHSASSRARAVVERSGAAGPLIGALLGALPQCGFSAMAATLFAGRVVSAGTLVAVVLSTSDEMVPVFLAHQEPLGRLLAIMGIKVVVGLAVGLIVDAVLRARHRAGDGHIHIHELCEREHCHCDDEHDHEHGSRLWAIVRSALVHTVQVTLFILLLTFAFGLVIEFVGQDALAQLLANHPVRATFLAALVGLIPNCGASVAICELFLDGVLATGPMLAGLLASGGVGLLVLWRTNANVRQNATVTLLVYLVAVVTGLLVGASGMLL